MKHATEEDLIPIAGLLDKIRCEKRVKERKSGVLYRRGKAFFALPRGSSQPLLLIFAVPDDWERVAVNDRRGQALLLAKMSRLLSNPG
jgi:hypothetical protein